MAGQVTTLFSDSAKQNELYPRTKTSAVSDANGNTLGDLAVYNAFTIISGVNPISVGVSIDLLWENSSPTANFPAQTIQMNLNDYQIVIVYARRSTSATYVVVAVCIVGQSSILQQVSLPNYASIMHRFFSVSTSGITFQNGGDQSGDNNGYIIPIAVYGFKGEV